jgi:hypothetical protein
LNGLEAWSGTDDDLRQAAPLFTSTWLFYVLPRALGTNQPALLNSKGDEVVFRTVTFPLTSDSSREEIVRRLNKLRPLREETPTFWNWIGQAPSKPVKSRDAETVTWNVAMEDGSVVLTSSSGTISCRRSARTACLRCQPVVAHSSSRTRPLTDRSDDR